MDIISSMTDREKTNAVLTQEEISNFAYEFCHAFDVRVGYDDKDSDGLKFYSVDGMPLGSIAYRRDRRVGSWPSSERESYYVYSSKAVCKEKSSKREGRSTRDAAKITGLISAVKRNNETPQRAQMRGLQDYKNGINTALHTTLSGVSNRATISLNNDMVIHLVEQYLGVVGVSPAKHSEVNDLYTSYLKEMEKKKSHHAVRNRFAKGCRAYGILSSENPIYATAIVEWDTTGEVVFKEPLKFYKTLADTEHVGDTVMVRTYMQGKDRSTTNNEFGISAQDQFFADMDFATGYSLHGEQWVILPLNAE